jgi:hypothetical protein
MTDTNGLIELAGADVLNIAHLYPSFLFLYNKEDQALEIIRKSALTDPIAEADLVRDTPYRGLVLLTEAYEHSSDETKVQAAKNIRVVIDHYGDFRTKSYNEETATIYNFLQDISIRCAADIAVLNAQPWIDDLAAANQAFDDLMNQRFDVAAAQEIINLRETRKEIDRVYAAITERIDASILLNGEADYADFVNKLNERIAYFKHTVSQRKGRAGKVTRDAQKA